MIELACTVGPLDHSLCGDPEYCCDLGRQKVHRFHPRHADWRTRDVLIWCCCKSVLTDTDWLAAHADVLIAASGADGAAGLA